MKALDYLQIIESSELGHFTLLRAKVLLLKFEAGDTIKVRGLSPLERR